MKINNAFSVFISLFLLTNVVRGSSMEYEEGSHSRSNKNVISSRVCIEEILLKYARKEAARRRFERKEAARRRSERIEAARRRSERIEAEIRDSKRREAALDKYLDLLRL